MPDIDVAAVGLSSPPQPAYLTQYRPAISVKNNGNSNAIASGYLRIYKAGALVFSTDVYSGTIPPGQTRLAEADTYWTPATTGTYMVQGYVTCFRDMVESNNNLAPVSILVQGGTPPPPPVVTAHAAQHEEGGTDELNVEGLEGKLADGQNAEPHELSHRAGGTDEINVAGLHGVLADGQPTAAHGNEKHTSTFATTAQLSEHATATIAHGSATNLELKANRGASNGYAPLDENSLVPAANLPPTATHGNESHSVSYEDTATKGQANGYCPLNASSKVAPAFLDPMPPGLASIPTPVECPEDAETTIIEADVPDTQNSGITLDIQVTGKHYDPSSPGTAYFNLYAVDDASAEHLIAQTTHALVETTSGKSVLVRATVGRLSTLDWAGHLEAYTPDASGWDQQIAFSFDTIGHLSKIRLKVSLPVDAGEMHFYTGSVKTVREP